MIYWMLAQMTTRRRLHDWLIEMGFRDTGWDTKTRAVMR